MFLHIGEDISVLKADIIAILDKETIEESEDTKKYLDRLIKKNKVDKIKTYILTLEDEDDYSLYTSNISSTTLMKRK